MSGPWTLAIDFGTTATVAAVRVGSGPTEVLDTGGSRRMPSVVVIEEDGTFVVGEAAAGLARSHPERTIRSPKTRLGDQVPVVVAGEPFQPVELAGAVLTEVRKQAVRYMGSEPSSTRLTYPATWNRPKRVRLLEAAVKAGLPNAELVAEPVAAALTYAETSSLQPGDHVAVYDLGGGTFDTAVLLRTASGFGVVGRPLGDPQLGGELFDEILLNHVGERIDGDAFEQLLVSEDPQWTRALSRLRNECVRVKEALSGHGVAEVSVGLPSGMVELEVTRAELEQLVEPYITESVELLTRCIDDAVEDRSRIGAIYITGGASRMPMVERMVSEAFPSIPISRRGDPKTVVAIGALLAEPATFDRSIAAAPKRTTIEEPVGHPTITETSRPAEPKAPSRPVTPPAAASQPSTFAPPAVPSGPPSAPSPTNAPAAAGPPATFVAPTPFASVGAPPTAAAPTGRSTPSGSAPTGPVGGGSAPSGTVLATIAAVVVLLIGGFAWFSRDRDTDQNTIADVTTVPDDGESEGPTTTPSTAPPTTPPTTAPPSTTGTVPPPTQPDVITQLDLQEIVAGAAAFGPDWAEGQFVYSEDSFCNNNAPTPTAVAGRLFEQTETGASIVIAMETYPSIEISDLAVGLDMNLPIDCPTGTIVQGEFSFDLTAFDPLTVFRPAPVAAEEEYSIGYIWRNETVPQFEGYQIGVGSRWGRTTGYVVVLTQGPPDEAMRELVNDLFGDLTEDMLELDR